MSVYTDRDRAAAFELFRGNQHQSMDELATALSQLAQPVSVPADTLRDWRNRHSWDNRIQEEIAAASPVLIDAHVSLARVAGVDGLTYIRDVANGKQEFSKHRYEAAVFLVEQVKPMLRYVTDQEAPVTVRPANLSSERKLTNAELVMLEVTPGYSS